MNNLYRYVLDRSSGKYRLLSTPELSHSLFGMQHFDPNKEEVWLCEGVWDAIALWEVANLCGWDDGKIKGVAEIEHSLATEVNILATPGCNVFRDEWVGLFKGKKVWILFDNDHPRIHPKTGKPIPPAALEGAKRVANLLLQGGAKEVTVLMWGPEGFSKAYPSGADVRDWVSGGLGVGTGTPKDRIESLAELLSKRQPLPPDWVSQETRDVAVSARYNAVECNDWKVLVGAWRKAMRWTEGLDRALSVMLASITSTKAVGDQLWVKIMGPASCGKTTLCEAISTAKDYVLAKSVIRGFHSGYRGEDKGEDASLIKIMEGMTLVTKDGDTLLQSPNFGQILAEARDLYDGVARNDYRNGVRRNYDRLRCTWILCGTASLRTLDSSELGERFLDCVIMRGVDPILEAEILKRAARSAGKAVQIEANGEAISQYEPDLATAMQLTGGYVNYLRQNAARLLEEVELSDELEELCINLGRFVSYMRARPSRKQEELAERELAARLVKQHIRLAYCLTVVLGKKKVDQEVMRRVRQVALDTARGRVQEICRHLFSKHPEGVEVRGLSLLCHETEDSLRFLLRFLGRIGAVECFKRERGVGLGNKPRWRLTPEVHDLYALVIKGEDEKGDKVFTEIPEEEPPAEAVFYERPQWEEVY